MECSTEEVRRRQHLFVMTVKLGFMNKLAKYNGHLVKQGIHIDYSTMESLTRRYSFDDNIELILCENSTKLHPRQVFKKLGNRLSLVKVVRWIYQLVQRTKAARILSHLNGVADKAIKEVVVTVATALSVAFEYQLMMLQEEGEVIKLARHAVSCMMFYLNTKGAAFKVEELLVAVLEVKPQTSKNKEVLKIQTVFIDDKPFTYKWKLGQLFKQPGLRIEEKEVKDELDAQLEDGENDSSEILDEPLQEKENIESVEGDDDTSVSLDEEDNKNIVIKTRKESSEVETDEENVAKKNGMTKEVSLHEVSAVILGPNDNQTGHKAGKTKRLIKTIEMDYELGKLHIEEHNVVPSLLVDDSEVDDSFDMTDAGENKDEDTEGVQAEVTEQNNLETGNTVMENDTMKAANPENGSPDEVSKRAEEPNLGVSLTGIQGATEDDTYQEMTKDCADNQKEHQNEYKYYGCFTPYGAKCRPNIYGFRGPLRFLDNEHGGYTLIYSDKVTIKSTQNEALEIDPKNPHQIYKPKTKMIEGNVVFM